MQGEAMQLAPWITKWGLLGVLVINGLALHTPDALKAEEDPTIVHVPAPSGPYGVGTLWLRLVDAARNDPFLHDGSKRELMVRFWYPALRVRGCPPAEYSSPKVWANVSELMGVPGLTVRTNSCANVPVLMGRHAVILVSHAYTGMFTDYTFLLEDLASRGYVVASVAHTYETTAAEFPDGRLLTSALGSQYAEGTLRTDEPSLQFAMSIRTRDLAFVVAELKRLDAGNSPFAGKLDLGRTGILGHSMGGDTAMTSLGQLVGIRAGVLLDPALLSPLSTRGKEKPLLLVSEGREEWSEAECELWSRLRGPHVALIFRGAEHMTSSDAVWLGSYVPGLHVETGTMGPEMTISAIRDYVADFFDAYLWGKPPGLLLNGLSTKYADVRVTTRTHALCGQAPPGSQRATLRP